MIAAVYARKSTDQTGVSEGRDDRHPALRAGIGRPDGRRLAHGWRRAGHDWDGRYAMSERLKGAGTVYHEMDKREFGEAEYDLTITPEYTWAGDERLEGIPTITGTVRLRRPPTGRPLSGENLVLRLEDGRSLPFFFTKGDGSISARRNLSKGPGDAD